MNELVNPNRKILEFLKTASESQLSERLRKKCEEFRGSDVELKAFFVELYNSCHESSSFIKAVVDPKFTSKY